MTRRVLILVPEKDQDDPRFSEAVDFHNRVGRLETESGLVVVDGQQIQVPKTWIHSLPKE